MFTENANRIFNRSIEDYHRWDDVDHPIDNPYAPGTIDHLLYHKNWIDTVQWHLEDIIRDPEIDPAEALKIKRRIDKSNQDRTDMVEYVDSYLLDKYKEVVPAPDARLNTVTVKAPTADVTYTFSTTDADKSEANGLLPGAPVVVDYTGKLEDGATATKIATDPTYAEAIGRWTMPDPIDPEGVMGVEIRIEGVAQSINMATLVYTSWELQGEADKILLKGESIGNGQTIGFTETGVIAKDAEGKYTLTIEGTGTVYTKAD